MAEKAMATHSSTLAWEILWMEQPDRLQSMGSQRVGHDWATSLVNPGQAVQTEPQPKRPGLQGLRWGALAIGQQGNGRLSHTEMRLRRALDLDSVTASCSICVWLFVTPWTVAWPGSSVHRILQARILEWVAISFSSFCLWPVLQREHNISFEITL